MKIKVLMENTVYSADYHAEHGLSLYLEACGRRILFDMGQSGAFAENAEKLGVDLADIDLAILSHGHYDHGGGLRTFLAANDHAPVYVSRFAFEQHGNAAGKDIGLDPELAAAPQLVFTDAHFLVSKGLELFSCNGLDCEVPIDPAGLSAVRNGKKMPEDFRHEQYLLIQEHEKRILISGCSHKGIVNLTHWFEPDVLIGGFHFMKVDPAGPEKKVLDDTAFRLMRHHTVFYTCHCTGTVQYEYLKKLMKTQLSYLSCGQTVEIGRC